MKLTLRISITKQAIITLIILLLAVGGAIAIHDHNKPKPMPPHTAENGNFNAGQRSAEVNIRNMMFTPSQVTVVRGTTVTWTNNDKVSHTVIIDHGDGPQSSNISPGASFSYTFNQAGSYQYHCRTHPSMRGTIVVQ
ncbi:MAG TPA: cupredoxin domain-containing protein [Candidatus Saccharimonadales bacterium]|nr:cupredoxin domain-containing protein [Candidatus Saccharimonadales bacterium]